jgi:hypothetical protein
MIYKSRLIRAAFFIFVSFVSFVVKSLQMRNPFLVRERAQGHKDPRERGSGNPEALPSFLRASPDP